MFFLIFCGLLWFPYINVCKEPVLIYFKPQFSKIWEPILIHNGSCQKLDEAIKLTFCIKPLVLWGLLKKLEQEESGASLILKSFKKSWNWRISKNTKNHQKFLQMLLCLKGTKEQTSFVCHCRPKNPHDVCSIPPPNMFNVFHSGSSF